MPDQNTTTTTAGDQTTTPPPATTVTPTWTDGLGDDLKGYVQTKGFKEPKDVLESYRNFEKLQGVPKDRLLALPESLEAKEMAQVWERLGAPKESKEYNIEIPKEHCDEKMAEWAKETFHKLKVPRAMAENFVKEWNARQLSTVNDMLESKKVEITNEHNNLKKEWGSAYEQNEKIANQAALKFGLSKEEVQGLASSMGATKAIKFLHKLGEGIGEAKFIDGNTAPTGVLTPDQAKSQIKQLYTDSDFSRRLQTGDVDAKNKWNRLHQMASPGEFTI